MGKWVLICWRSFGLLVSRMIGAEIWDFDCGAKEPRDACACATSPDITKCGAKKTTRTPHYLKINGCLNNMSFSCSYIYIHTHIYICLIYVYVCMQVVYSFFSKPKRIITQTHPQHAVQRATPELEYTFFFIESWDSYVIKTTYISTTQHVKLNFHPPIQHQNSTEAKVEKANKWHKHWHDRKPYVQKRTQQWHGKKNGTEMASKRIHIQVVLFSSHPVALLQLSFLHSNYDTSHDISQDTSPTITN